MQYHANLYNSLHTSAAADGEKTRYCIDRGSYQNFLLRCSKRNMTQKVFCPFLQCPAAWPSYYYYNAGLQRVPIYPSYCRV